MILEAIMPWLMYSISLYWLNFPCESRRVEKLCVSQGEGGETQKASRRCGLAQNSPTLSLPQAAGQASVLCPRPISQDILGPQYIIGATRGRVLPYDLGAGWGERSKYQGRAYSRVKWSLSYLKDNEGPEESDGVSLQEVAPGQAGKSAFCCLPLPPQSITLPLPLKIRPPASHHPATKPLTQPG